MKVVVLVVFTFVICLVRAELEESDENIGEVNNNNLNNVTTQKSTDGDTHHNNTTTNMVLNNTSGLVENSENTKVKNDLLQSNQTIAQIPLNIGEIGTLETINNTKSSESDSPFNITPEILANYTQENGSNGVDFESGKNALILNPNNRPETSTNTTTGVLLLPTNVTFDFSSNNTRDDISPASNVSNSQNITNGDNDNTISTTSSSENLVINYNNISEVLKNDTFNFVSVTVNGILHNETMVDNNAIIIQSEILTSSEVSTKTMNENTTPFEMISNVTDIKGTGGTENNNTSNKTDAELLNQPENNVNDRFDTTKNNILPSNITNDTLLNSNSTVLPEISINKVNHSTTNATPKEIIENTNTAEGNTTNKIEVPEHLKNYTSSTNIISNNTTNEVTSDDAGLFFNHSTSETNVTKVSNVYNSTTASHNVPIIMDGMQNDQSIQTEQNKIYTTDSYSKYESNHSGGVNNTTTNDTISKEIIEGTTLNTNTTNKIEATELPKNYTSPTNMSYTTNEVTTDNTYLLLNNTSSEINVTNVSTMASHNDSVIMDDMQNDQTIETEQKETHTTDSYNKNETNHGGGVNNTPNDTIYKEMTESTTTLTTNTAKSNTTSKNELPELLENYTSPTNIPNTTNEVTTDTTDLLLYNATIGTNVTKVSDVNNQTTASQNESVIMDGMQNDESIERERNETQTTASYSKNETNYIPQVVTVPDQEFNSTIKSTTPVNVTVGNDTLVILTTPEQPGGNNNNTNVTQLPNTMSSYPNVYYLNNTTSHNGTTIIVLPGGQNHTQPPNQPYHPGGGTLLIPAGVRPNSAISINVITNLVVPIVLSTTAMYLVK